MHACGHCFCRCRSYTGRHGSHAAATGWQGVALPHLSTPSTAPVHAEHVMPLTDSCRGAKRVWHMMRWQCTSRPPQCQGVNGSSVAAGCDMPSPRLTCAVLVLAVVAASWRPTVGTSSVTGSCSYLPAALNGRSTEPRALARVWRMSGAGCLVSTTNKLTTSYVHCKVVCVAASPSCIRARGVTQHIPAHAE
jgi:hypothetical protein